MEIMIKATEEEKLAVVAALRRLNAVRHLKYMSQAMISEETGIKTSKVRIVLQDLIDEGTIVQYTVDNERRIKRYYYVVQDKKETQPEKKEAPQLLSLKK